MQLCAKPSAVSRCLSIGVPRSATFAASVHHALNRLGTARPLTPHEQNACRASCAGEGAALPGNKL